MEPFAGRNYLSIVVHVNHEMLVSNAFLLHPNVAVDIEADHNRRLVALPIENKSVCAIITQNNQATIA